MKKKFTSTQALSMVTITAGFLILSIGALLKKIGTGSKLELFAEGIIVVTAFFIWGCTGIVWIVRREAPQGIILRGKPAVILGLILVISSWGISLYGLYLVIMRLIS